MKSRIPVLLVTAALLSLSASVFAGPKLYKWVDEKGVVHYGTSIPPQYAKQKSQVINAQGTVLKTIEAQKTPEQIAAEKKQKAAAEAKAKQAAEQAAAQRAHDQVLLDTYTEVADIEHDRDRRLGAVDSQINVTNTSIAGLQSSLANYQGQADGYAKRHKPVPDDLQQKLDAARNQLADTQKLLLDQQHKKDDIRARFGADIARFKELKGQQTGQQPPAGG
ncbi:MAG TPA: DUF4124 domain-containing protein [Gammaproteobacteria bacterium]|nr:DUF4124 domain-containing protein [Gammaproteobacteria bacterium]